MTTIKLNENTRLTVFEDKSVQIHQWGKDEANCVYLVEEEVNLIVEKIKELKE